jgi:hypothetical protein
MPTCLDIHHLEGVNALDVAKAHAAGRTSSGYHSDDLFETRDCCANAAETAQG